jgi:hypothetical protein
MPASKNKHVRKAKHIQTIEPRPKTAYALDESKSLKRQINERDRPFDETWPKERHLMRKETQLREKPSSNFHYKNNPDDTHLHAVFKEVEKDVRKSIHRMVHQAAKIQRKEAYKILHKLAPSKVPVELLRKISDMVV